MAKVPRRGWTKANEERAQKAGFGSYAKWIAVLEEDHGHEVCGAWARSKTRPCTKEPPHGGSSGRCHIHGDKALKGAENPAATHLKYSKYVPQVWLGPLQERAGDPRLVGLEQEIALTDVLIQSKLERWRDAGPPRRVQTIVGRMNRAREENDVGGLQQAWLDLEEATADYIDADALALDLLPMLNTRRRLSQAQAKIMQTAHDMVTREELTTFSRLTLDALTRALERHVPDAVQRRQVVTSLVRDLREVGEYAA